MFNNFIDNLSDSLLKSDEYNAALEEELNQSIGTQNKDEDPNEEGISEGERHKRKSPNWYRNSCGGWTHKC